MKKKLFVFFKIVGMTIPVFARGHHHHHGGSDGVRLATDIVNLVGASLNILYPRPVVVTSTPMVAPVVPAPVVVPAAPPPPVVYYNGAVLPGNVINPVPIAVGPAYGGWRRI